MNRPQSGRPSTSPIGQLPSTAKRLSAISVSRLLVSQVPPQNSIGLSQSSFSSRNPSQNFEISIGKRLLTVFVPNSLISSFNICITCTPALWSHLSFHTCFSLPTWDDPSISTATKFLPCPECEIHFHHSLWGKRVLYHGVDRLHTGGPAVWEREQRRPSSYYYYMEQGEFSTGLAAFFAATS